jgi:hypothetical protein
MVDLQTPVKGCCILKPAGFQVWEGIRDSLDARLRATGHSNVCVSCGRCTCCCWRAPLACGQGGLGLGRGVWGWGGVGACVCHVDVGLWWVGWWLHASDATAVLGPVSLWCPSVRPTCPCRASIQVLPCPHPPVLLRPRGRPRGWVRQGVCGGDPPPPQFRRQGHPGAGPGRAAGRAPGPSPHQ